jgi:hypothetical protein
VTVVDVPAESVAAGADRGKRPTAAATKLKRDLTVRREVNLV